MWDRVCADCADQPPHLLPECDLHLGFEDQHHTVDESLTGQLWRLSMPDPVSTIVAVPALARDGLQYVMIKQDALGAADGCSGGLLQTELERGLPRD